MRYALTLLFAIYLCSLAHGQGTVSGSVFGEGRDALVGASVYLLREQGDSVAQSSLTDDKGNFCFKGVSKGSYQVCASYLSRNSVRKKIMVWGDAHIAVDLHINEGTELKEVTVVSHGVTVNGDPTTYIANRFMSGSERTLKDMLGKLPNIHVDEETKTITAKGKKVSRILLEDNDLFQGNTSIPLDNLSADGIRKVQVIDNYSEYNIYNGFNSTNETVLNVGVDDKTKNRIKGELEASGGIENKYTARNTSLYIGKKWMASAIVAANNTGNRLLTFQDIMQFSGGMGNLLSGDDPMDQLLDKLRTFSAFTNNRRDIARRTNGMASLNCTFMPSQKVKLTIGGIYGQDHHHTRRESLYSYLSGLNYREETRESGRQHNGVLNIKLSYTPRKDLSLVYSGNLLLATQTSHEASLLTDGNSLFYTAKPNALHTTNNLLLTKRFGKDVLSLSMDVCYDNNKETSTFDALRAYYTPALNLDNAHGQHYKNSNNTYALQLFFLHRLNSAYYLRLALKGTEDRQRFDSHIEQDSPTKPYGNSSHLDYTTNYGEASIGRDQGKLNFSLRARYVLQHTSTNLRRNLQKRNAHFFSPLLQAKYQFSPFHHLTMNYEWKKNPKAIADLADGQWLNSYHQVESCSVDKLFSATHKASLQHMLSLQHMGLYLISMASYENTTSPTVYDYHQEGYVSVLKKRLGDHKYKLTLMSSAEYKLVNLPVNIRAQAQYDHSRTPFISDGTHYRAASQGLLLSLQATSYYKKGFNGKIRWDLSRHSHTGTPASNHLTTHNLTGQLTWQNRRLYASVDARLSTYSSDLTRTGNMFYGFESRYELTKTIMLKIEGTDLMHLGERKQMTGQATPYYSTNNLTWYMPGHIMAGLTIKY